jgi:hypothetical protein
MVMDGSSIAPECGQKVRKAKVLFPSYHRARGRVSIIDTWVGLTRPDQEKPMQEYVRIKSVQLLADDWYVLKKTVFDLKRRDGRWQTMSRETYDRGNGAVALLYNRARRTVLLTRQFRFPATSTSTMVS